MRNLSHVLTWGILAMFLSNLLNIYATAAIGG